MLMTFGDRVTSPGVASDWLGDTAGADDLTTHEVSQLLFSFSLSLSLSLSL